MRRIDITELAVLNGDFSLGLSREGFRYVQVMDDDGNDIACYCWNPGWHTIRWFEVMCWRMYDATLGGKLTLIASSLYCLYATVSDHNMEAYVAWFKKVHNEPVSWYKGGSDGIFWIGNTSPIAK